MYVAYYNNLCFYGTIHQIHFRNCTNTTFLWFIKVKFFSFTCPLGSTSSLFYRLHTDRWYKSICKYGNSISVFAAHVIPVSSAKAKRIDFKWFMIQLFWFIIQLSVAKLQNSVGIFMCLFCNRLWFQIRENRVEIFRGTIGGVQTLYFELCITSCIIIRYNTREGKRQRFIRWKQAKKCPK